MRLKKNFCRFALLLGATLPLVVGATENLPRLPFGQWTELPPEKQFVITPGYTYNYWKHYWKNHEAVDIQRRPQDGFDHNTGYVRTDYSVTEALALDLTIGGTSGATRFFHPTREPQTSMGLMDTQLGVRYRLANEGKEWWRANFVARAGGIIKGSYEADFPFAPGDGSSGGELMVGFTKQICSGGFGLYGDLGWRIRDHNVPQTFFATAGASQTLTFDGWARTIRMHFGYAHLQDLSGGDVTGTLVNVTYDHTVKEVARSVEGGIGLTSRNGWHYQYYMELSLDGRNTPIKTLYGLYLSIPVGGK